MPIYTTDNDKLQVAVHYYPVDGFQCTISVWDGDDFVTLYDKRVIADSVWEGIGFALTGSMDLDWWQADELLAGWGIVQPDDEEEDNQ
jgi:hypothetical protein